MTQNWRFVACWASFFAKRPLEGACRAKFFAGEPVKAPRRAKFFVEQPRNGLCWANFFAETLLESPCQANRVAGKQPWDPAAGYLPAAHQLSESRGSQPLPRAEGRHRHRGDGRCKTDEALRIRVAAALDCPRESPMESVASPQRGRVWDGFE